VVHEIEHGLRTTRAGCDARRIAHRLRQVTRSNEKHVDAFDLENFVEIPDSLRRFDHHDDELVVVVVRTRVTHGPDNVARVVRGMHERHHHAVRAAVQASRNSRAVLALRAHDGVAATEAGRLGHLLQLLETCRAVFAVDENRVGAGARELLGQA
jgi:hypothetical protein